VFNVNFRNIAFANIPTFLRKIKLLAVIYSAMKAMQDVNDLFLAFRTEIKTQLQYNGQKIYLEQYLNTTYGITIYNLTDRDVDIAAGDIIYIEDVTNDPYTFIFNAAEQATETYLYNNYDAAVTYAEDEYSMFANDIYISLQNANTNNTPDVSPLWWSDDGDVLFLLNQEEFDSLFDFIVYVPVAVTYDENVMTAQVNQYKIAGKRYYIDTY